MEFGHTYRIDGHKRQADRTLLFEYITEYDYIHDTTSHCSCSVVARVSTNFSDNPRMCQDNIWIFQMIMASDITDIRDETMK